MSDSPRLRAATKIPKKVAKPRATKTKAKKASTNPPRKRDKAKARAMALAIHEIVEDVKQGNAGRPTDYRPQYAILAERLCLLNVGIKDADLAQFFEVNEDTIHEWKLKHPEFSESIKQGKDYSDLDVVNGLYQRAKGATYVVQEVVKRKVVEYDDKTGKKRKEEELVEVVPVVKSTPPDPVAAKYWLNNRRRKETTDRQWVDKVELTHSGGPDPIKTEEVGLGFARKMAFMLEIATRRAAAAQTALTVVSAPEDEPVSK